MSPPPPPHQLPFSADKDPSRCGSDTRLLDAEDAESEHLEIDLIAKPALSGAKDNNYPEPVAVAGRVGDGYHPSGQSTNQLETTSSNSTKQPRGKDGVQMDQLEESRPVDTSESHHWSKEERNAAHLARKRRNAYIGYGTTPQTVPTIQGSDRISASTGTHTTIKTNFNPGIMPRPENAAQGISAAVGGTNAPATAPENQSVQDLIRLALMAGFGCL